MPGSSSTFGSRSRSYESADEFHLYTDNAILIDQKKKDSDLEIEMSPSPVDSKVLDTPAISIPTPEKDEKLLLRALDRGAPGDKGSLSQNKTPEEKELSRRRNQYYDEAFAYRESNSSARERISKESLVMADIKTNVIIKDEYTFVTDLSCFLSGRYQRPESSIIVALTHSACLLFRGSFDPAYIFSITALPSQVQPTTNRRNAALIQTSLEESLGVCPERGLVKFISIPEENIASNGKTVSGAIEDLEMGIGEYSLGRTLSPGKTRSTTGKTRSTTGKIKRSTKSMHDLKISGPLSTHSEQRTPLRSDEGSPAVPEIPTEKSMIDQRAAKAQRMGRRKSFIASMFSR